MPVRSLASEPIRARTRSALRRLLPNARPLDWRRRDGAALSLIFLSALAVAGQQDAARNTRFAVGIEGGFRALSEEAAQRRLADAARVARTMSSITPLADLLGRARGVYIVPVYGRAAAGVGAAVGSGVLMVRRPAGHWGNPAFFTMGEIGLGLQAGIEGGPIALLLMNRKAVDSFRERDNVALNADVGLTVVNYSRITAATTAGDVFAWSGVKGLFGNAATLSISDIRYNNELMQAHYGKRVTLQQVVDGARSDPRADALRNALGERVHGVTAN